MKIPLLLATGLALATATARPANAQDVTSVAPATSAAQVAADDSLAAAIGVSYLDNNVRGFGKAEILGSEGKTHAVWIPINPNGFNKFLPFHRSEVDARRFGREPFSIDINKVQSVTLNGLYQEHMVLNGKRKRLLATRLVNGPVELFNYTEIQRAGGAMVPVAGGGFVMGAPGLGFPDRQWFVRRAGQELVKVERVDFVAQMTAFFQDDLEVVAALSSGRLHYRDMVKLVQGYNEFRTRPATK